MEETKVKVWDLPVRICHWCFALMLPAMWWTAENSEMGWHKRIGTVLLALLLFRILWGFAGPSTARFSQFVKGPKAVLAYVRGSNAHHLGHNPTGGWSALALILLMTVQVSTGLFAGDPFDGATGPLNDLVRSRTAGMLTDWHEILFNALLGLVALHLVAIAYYAVVKKDNLVKPMLSGQKQVPANTSGMVEVPMWRAAICAGVSGVFAYWVWTGGSGL